MKCVAKQKANKALCARFGVLRNPNMDELNGSMFLNNTLRGQEVEVYLQNH